MEPFGDLCRLELERLQKKPDPPGNGQLAEAPDVLEEAVGIEPISADPEGARHVHDSAAQVRPPTAVHQGPLDVADGCAMRVGHPLLLEAPKALLRDDHELDPVGPDPPRRLRPQTRDMERPGGLQKQVVERHRPQVRDEVRVSARERARHEEGIPELSGLPERDKGIKAPAEASQKPPPGKLAQEDRCLMVRVARHPDRIVHPHQRLVLLGHRFQELRSPAAKGLRHSLTVYCLKYSFKKYYSKY